MNITRENNIFSDKMELMLGLTVVGDLGRSNNMSGSLFPLAVRTIVPATIAGVTTGAAANAGSKAVTGKTTEEIATPYVGNTLSFIGNPGSYVGANTFYNFKNFGRYVVDNVRPASYKGHGLYDFGKAIGKAFYKRPPKFDLQRHIDTKGREGHVPDWYKKGTVWGDQNERLENMALWAGIPEKEIPRKTIFKNSDGTYGFNKTSGAEIMLESMQYGIGQKKEGVKNFVWGVGGEHSDYTLIKDNNPRSTSPNGFVMKTEKPQSIWVYEDEQKINPQWKLSDKVKKYFNINDENNTLGKRFNDWWGGLDLKGFLGFDHNVKYKQTILDNNGKLLLGDKSVNDKF